MKTLRIAHRGAKGYAPENTLASFGKALDMQCDGIEFDVHLSADDEIIVIHDETTNRTTGFSGVITKMKLQELKRLRINGTEEIPTLAEVLDLVDRNCLVNIELKAEATAKPVVAAIEKYIGRSWKYNHFLVSSFDWNALKEIREINPKIPLGVLTMADLDLAIGFAEFIEAETIHPYFHLLTRENVKAMQEKGFGVFPWTINEPEDISKIKSFRVNGIISDFPDRI